MKKTFKFYLVIWAILIAVFNLVVFLARPVIPGYDIEYDARFWIAWAFIIATFIGNLICAFYSFKEENLQKVFYRLSLAKIAWSALISMVVVGVAIFLIPNCPAWIATIVCALILAFNAIAVIKALLAVSAVEKIDEKVKAQTAFIKLLTADSEGLVARAKSDVAKEECRKVYEAVRYSDPMSNNALIPIEDQITAQFRVFDAAIRADDAELVKSTSEELLALIGDRNRKCKVLK